MRGFLIAAGLGLGLVGCGSGKTPTATGSIGSGSPGGTPPGGTSPGTPGGTTSLQVDPGVVSLCGGTDAAAAATGPWSVTGTVVEQGTLAGDGAPVDTAPTQLGPFNCQATTHRYLTVEEASGELWHFAWDFVDGPADGQEPTLDLNPGETVTVHFDQTVNGYSPVSALSVLRGGSLVAGFVGASDDNAPLAGSFGSLAVNRGSAQGRSSELCGLTEWYALDFDGASTVSVDVGASGTVEVDAQNFVGWNLGAWELVGTTTSCTDNANTRIDWAIWAP